MRFISSIFSIYFSIMEFSIITKIIVLFAVVLYIYSLIKLLHFKFIELIYSFIGFTVGLLGIVIVGSIYRIIYHMLVFIIFGAKLEAFYTIPFDDIGCVILTVTFLMFSYAVLERLLDDYRNPIVISKNKEYNSNRYTGGGLLDEYNRGHFEFISYSEFLQRRQTKSFDELYEEELDLISRRIIELYEEEMKEKEERENWVTVTREWDYHTGDYVEETHYKF